MKIEEGKYYLTRNGRKVGPMLKRFLLWRGHDDPIGYYDNGRQFLSYETGHDIISECKDETPSPSAP